jgi:hypothetical protein
MEPEDSMHCPQKSANNQSRDSGHPTALLSSYFNITLSSTTVSCMSYRGYAKAQEVTGFGPRRPGFAPGTIYGDCARRSGNEAGLSMLHNETPSYIILAEYSPPPPLTSPLPFRPSYQNVVYFQHVPQAVHQTYGPLLHDSNNIWRQHFIACIKKEKRPPIKINISSAIDILGSLPCFPLSHEYSRISPLLTPHGQATDCYKETGTALNHSLSNTLTTDLSQVAGYCPVKKKKGHTNALELLCFKALTLWTANQPNVGGRVLEKLTINALPDKKFPVLYTKP